MQAKHTVKIDPDPVNKEIFFVTTEPRFGIGQRAILFVTSDGIWMWDCIAVINDQAVEELKAIEAKTGKKLQGIVISHPHFYTTSLSWAQALDTYVYISHQDLQWYQRRESSIASTRLRPIAQKNLKHSTDIESVCVGGHFEGSRVFLHKPSRTLGVADSIYVTPRRTASFMWSYPNMIPLPPDAIHGIWDSVKGLPFDRVLGGFEGQEIRTNGRKIIQDSAQLWLRAAGWEEKGLGLSY